MAHQGPEHSDQMPPKVHLGFQIPDIVLQCVALILEQALAFGCVQPVGGKRQRAKGLFGQYATPCPLEDRLSDFPVGKRSVNMAGLGQEIQKDGKPSSGHDLSP